jgi:hypothetical protein
MWGWIVAGVGVLFVFTQFKGKSTAAAAATTPTGATAPGISGNNGNVGPPNIFFLPNGTYNTPNPQQLTVNVNRIPGGGPDWQTPGTPVNNTPTPVVTPGGGGGTGPIIGGGPFGQPPPNQAPPPPPQPHYQTVTVEKWPGVSQNGLAQWDTTLWGIANHFGKTVNDLAALNNISNPNLIYPGQQIRVPV